VHLAEGAAQVTRCEFVQEYNIAAVI